MSLDPAAVAASKAFVATVSLPPLRSGPLDGLRFTIKDNIDLAGMKTSYGSPAWRDAHPAAVRNAVCVDQILAAGAHGVGKVIADEFTYSLEGENHFFGTPLNPKAPERMPGGSSSGSASSVACGLADFSLGTDSGGSIRIPASFCGIWGMRPSTHRISEAGVLPFMPSVSTVGVCAASFDILDKVMRVLLGSGPHPVPEVTRLVVLEDALALADAPVSAAAEQALAALADHSGLVLERVSVAALVGFKADLSTCNAAALRHVQSAEFQSTGGTWIEQNKPALGPGFARAFQFVRGFNRAMLPAAQERCQQLFNGMQAFLQPGVVLCFPTAPTPAPLKGSLTTAETVSDFYGRTMGITAFSGVGRLPEITAPLLSADGLPVGLSLVAGHGLDEFLLAAARRILPLP